MTKHRLRASFSARTALIGLEIRQDSCVQSPRLEKNLPQSGIPPIFKQGLKEDPQNPPVF